MKKLAIVTMIALTSLTAAAGDIGLRIGRNTTTETNNAGITFSEKIGPLGVEASYDRMVVGAQESSRYALLGTYDVAKFGKTLVTAKGGVAYVEPRAFDNSYAGVAGVGVTYPLTKTVKLTADYAYQKGQSKIVDLDGNIYSVGVKYSF